MDDTSGEPKVVVDGVRHAGATNHIRHRLRRSIFHPPTGNQRFQRRTKIRFRLIWYSVGRDETLEKAMAETMRICSDVNPSRCQWRILILQQQLPRRLSDCADLYAYR